MSTAGQQIASNANSNVNQNVFGNILYNVKTYGAKGNGTTDDTAAIQNTINTVYAAGGGIVFFPPGSYLVRSTVLLKTGVSLMGSGIFATTIKTDVTNLTMFSMVFTSSGGANLDIKDLLISATASGVKGFQFTYCNQVHLDKIFFLGCLINAEFDRGGLNRIDNCISAGTSTLKAGQLKLWSSTDTEYGCVFSEVRNYRIDGGNGVQSPAIYFRRAVGIKCNQIITNNSNYTGTCLLFENDCQGITIENSIIVAYGIGAVFQRGTGSVDLGPSFCTFSNVDFDQCSTNSILVTQANNLTLSGGQITSSAVATTTQAITVQTSKSDTIHLNGIQITGYYGPTSGAAVYLVDTVFAVVENCVIQGCYNGISLGGANTNLTIRNNTIKTINNAPLAGSAAGVGNAVIQNKGIDGTVTIGSPAFPATTVAVTNNFGFPARIFITGGTISIIKINGQGGVFTNGMVLLMPGENISVTYTGSPSWNWIGM